jgi:hypothetical protein
MASRKDARNPGRSGVGRRIRGNTPGAGRGKAASSSAKRGAPAATRTLEAKLRELESRLRALEQNPVLQLAGVLELDNARCKTVRITGNLQIVNGMGRTNTTNGCGNLILGYDELPPAGSGWPNTRAGSHNLVIGRFHSHASYGGLLAGEMNLTSANAPASCVVGGSEGTANADRVVIVGGHEGKANAERTVILGGFDNGASPGAARAVVVGGTNNRAQASSSCIFGGGHNTTNASAGGSTILGGSSLATHSPGERIP